MSDEEARRREARRDGHGTAWDVIKAKMKLPFGTKGTYSLPPSLPPSLSLSRTLLNDNGDSDSDTTLTMIRHFPLQIPVITYMEGLYTVTDKINSQHGLIRFSALFVAQPNDLSELRGARMGNTYVCNGWWEYY